MEKRLEPDRLIAALLREAAELLALHGENSLPSYRRGPLSGRRVIRGRQAETSEEAP